MFSTKCRIYKNNSKMLYFQIFAAEITFLKYITKHTVFGFKFVCFRHTSYLSFHLHRHSVRLKYFRPKTCYLWQNWIGVKTVNRQIGQKVCVPCMSSSPFEERAQYMWWSSSWPVCVSVVVVITWAANHIEGPPLPDSANIRQQWGFHQFLDQAERSTGELVM